MRGLAVAAVVVLGAGAGSAMAQDRAVTRGFSIAQTWCVECHAIGDADQPGALAAAPPFKDLAADPAFGEDTLRRALLLPHPAMPEFPVTRDDIKALAAYIHALADSPPVPEERTAIDGGVILASDDGGAAARGRAIVAQNCAPCHRIEGVGESPVAAAPAFATLSERYPVAYLAEALAEGIVVGHEQAAVEMPQFAFPPDDVGAIIAYLESVQATAAH